jgi:ABC-type antimicrobial peptide transport system permease subunit
MKEKLIEISDVWKKYDMGKAGTLVVLKEINLEISAGEFVAITGPSGSGKSTMMNIVGALDVPSYGEVKLMGKNISLMNESELAYLRGQTIGFIFQQFNLIKNLSALKNVMLSRGILFEEDKDFSVSNLLSMQETISSTLNTLSIFLGAIAAISLLVGGIGIANTMFTSVLEKTKEIGIMKAIGVKNLDVLMIYLLNAGLIGLVGGIGGILVGGISSVAISSIAGITTSSTTSGRGGGMMSNMFSSSYLSWELILGALLFSILIGMIAGVIPAYRASRLKPVDALRYE